MRAIRSAIRPSIRSSFGLDIVDKLRALIASLFGNGEQGAFYIPQPVVNGAQALFQDSAGTTPVTADGDPVGRMLDQSGDGNHATQAVSGSRPVYPGLTYDGVDDFLDTGKTSFGSTSLFADASEEFYVAATINVAPNTDGTVLSKAGFNGSTRTFQLFFNSVASSSSPSIVIRGAQIDTDWGLDDNQDHVVWANWDGSVMTVGYDNNDGQVISVGTAALESTQRIIIGARTNGTGFLLTGGKVGGVVIRDKALTIEEQALTASFLLSKGTS